MNDHRPARRFAASFALSPTSVSGSGFQPNVRGMLEGRQPPIEHAETLGYAAFAIAARQVRPD